MTMPMIGMQGEILRLLAMGNIVCCAGARGEATMRGTSAGRPGAAPARFPGSAAAGFVLPGLLPFDFLTFYLLRFFIFKPLVLVFPSRAKRGRRNNYFLEQG